MKIKNTQNLIELNEKECLSVFGGYASIKLEKNIRSCSDKIGNPIISPARPKPDLG